MNWRVVLGVSACLVVAGQTFHSPALAASKGKQAIRDQDLDGDGFSFNQGDCLDTVGYASSPRVNPDAFDGSELVNGFIEQFPGELPGVDDNCDCVYDADINSDADGDGFSIAEGDCDDYSFNGILNALATAAHAAAPGQRPLAFYGSVNQGGVHGYLEFQRNLGNLCYIDDPNNAHYVDPYDPPVCGRNNVNNLSRIAQFPKAFLDTFNDNSKLKIPEGMGPADALWDTMIGANEGPRP